MRIKLATRFAIQLNSNNPDIRERALHKIGKIIKKITASSEELNEDIFLKIWKGLFHYFWHCDEMLLQEERAEVVSQYIHSFKTMKYSMLYIDAFFATMSSVWCYIDHNRIEKFKMLVEQFLRQCFQLLKNKSWKAKCIKGLLNVLKKTVLNPFDNEGAPFGLKTFISDIYMDELAGVGHDEVTPEILRNFLLPYCDILCYSDCSIFLSCVEEDVFLFLIWQHDWPDGFPTLKFDKYAVQNLMMQRARNPKVKDANAEVMRSIYTEFALYSPENNE